ncbi:Tad domain-containing protein [Isosphaeraceae bacterium EP7]
MMKHPPRRRGAVAVFVALCLLPIVLTMALVIDGGMLMSQRRQAQAVADATAHAAACALAKNYATDAGLDPRGLARAAALSIAADNGYANDGTTTSVVLTFGYGGQAGRVQALVTYYQPRYFSSVISSGTIPVSARALGRVDNTAPPSILLTDPSAAGALTLTGGAKLTANGSIQVNSSSPGAVNASNGAYATNNGGLSVVGGVGIPNWATPTTFFSKAPTTGQAAAADPYASLATPTTAGLDPRSAPNPPYGTATMNPGVYTGGLTLGGGMTITMNPGVYYMKNGGFNVANGVTLNGTGVTIYIDSGGGAISLQGGTTVNLTAPTTGATKGIVYFQDRGNTSNLNNIANGSNVKMSGTLYAPNAALTIAGGATGSQYGSQFIVKSLYLSNNANIAINTSASSSSTSAPYLME